MHRFFVDPTQINQTAVSFTPAQSHQIQRVLRMRVGDVVELLDGQGFSFVVRLTAVSGDAVTGEIESQRVASGEPTVALTLFQAMLKRDKFEWVLQKGTEVGVTHFVPLITERSLVQTRQLKQSKQSRWETILTEAAEQSGRGRIPTLHDPLSLDSLLAGDLPTLTLIAWVGEETAVLRDQIAHLKTAVRTAGLLIGPEGGWSEAEVARCRERGIRPFSMGARILRTETAAIVGSALLLHELESL